MTITKVKTNPAGPATLDIQIEQGANFYIHLSLKKGGVTWPLDGATFSARMSPQWSPGEEVIEFVVSCPVPASGDVYIEMNALATASLALPSQPQKTTADQARKFQYGGWVFEVTQAGITERIIDGNVTIDRDPCKS